MTNVVGKGTLQVGVDGSQAEAGLDGVKESVRELGTEVGKTAKTASSSFKVLSGAADDTGNRIDRSGQRVLKSLENQANRATMTAAEYARLRAEQAGVATAAAPYIARIDAASRGTAQLGMSAKATAAAMRGVPAQITDIAVSLQGGQNPLTVFLQQGGQLKDMFGGVVPAAKALGASLLGLINPYTVVAAAVAGLGYAYYSGSQEATKYGKAIIDSGNYAGQSIGSLQALTTTVAKATNATQSQVAATAAAAVSTGQISGDMLQAVITSAVQLEKTAGQAVEKTIEQFIALGKDPAQASAALNQQYNYLTASVYDQIVALQKQGDTQGAVKLAAQTYADTVSARTKEVQQNLGYIERAWNAVKSATVGAIDAAKGIGRDATAQETLAGLEREARAREDNIKRAEAAGATISKSERTAANDARLNAQIYKDQLATKSAIAAAAGLEAKNQQKTIAARQELARLDDQIASKAQQREKAEREIRRIGRENGLSEKQIADRIALSNERLKDPKGPSTAARDNAATTMLLQLKEREASLRAQADSEAKLTDDVKKRAEFERLIGELKDKKVLTADQKSLLANAESLKTQLDKNVAVAAEVKQREALIKLEERSEQIQNAIASSQASRQEQYDRSLGALGLGQKAQERVGAESSIRREFQRYQDQLAKATPKALIGGSQYNEERAKLAASLEDALSQQRSYYAEVDRMQGDWKAGVRSAMADYVDFGTNAYAQAGQAFQSITSGMEDAFANFVTSGKASFSDFARSIIADLARIAARQAIVGAIGSISGALIGGASASATAASYQPGSAGYIPTVDVTGGRAIGGPVSPRSLYEVNERGPELLNTGGKQLLMMGQQGGSVTPLKALSASGGGSPGDARPIEVNISISESATQSSAPAGYESFGREVAQLVDQRFKVLEAKSYRQGGAASMARNGRI